MAIRRPFLALSCAALACLPLVACSSLGSHESASAGAAAEAGAKGDKDGDKNDAEKKEEKQDEIAKKEFELECGKLELQIKRLSIDASNRSTQEEIAAAERELRDAKEAVETFQAHEKPLKLADGQLDLDESEQFRKQAQQELDELKAMYKQEELASLTKELVVSRSEKQLEFAKRRFEMQVKNTEHQRSTALPRHERELGETLAKAEKALAEKRQAAEKQKLEQQLELMRAERGLKDLEKEIAKLKKAADKPEAAS